MLRKLFGFLGKDLAMDLGTANTLLFTRADGIVLNEPSVVAIETERNSVLAVGREAKEYLGRTPQRIRAIRPMKDGVIADFEVTRQMIEFFIRKVIKGFNIVKPGIVICVPTGITQVEKRAVIESPGRVTCVLSKNPWRLPSVPTCPSMSLWAAWSWTSAVARPKLRSSPCPPLHMPNRCAWRATP